VPFLKKKILF